MKKLGLLFLLIIFCNKGFSQTTTTTQDTIVTGGIEKNCPGGFKAYTAYISKNAHFPAVAVEQGISGTVRVMFLVEPNGTISHVHATTQLGSGLEEEAIRVIKASYGWLPSVVDGKNVRTWLEVGVKYTPLTSYSRRVDGEMIN